MKLHAQIFYMSQVLGIIEQTHDKVSTPSYPKKEP
jgi:hypothetical protein